ncbi:uncharacterized protein KGF55_003615 [Candida pseudojiufengensis]|uniref:uncharacterized protein n=1 Tax=Candida pseudojiufengensis TaxID=497109 RepID=UPI0022249FB4|nr:uncharacterized protein KGF55_003615 [Candida pseudojiufengensis]KAI5962539.1 hypothetical protein KGF55_003615 [Candida pseudojiufengensis]
MKIFLDLPNEVIALVIKYIDDKSKILELVAIPPLQEIALKERFSTYHITSYCDGDGDGCIEALKLLYHEFKFKPSKIIGEIFVINKLLNFENSGSETLIPNCHRDISDVVDYTMSKFVVLFTPFSTFTDLKKIMDYVSVVGISMFSGSWDYPSDKGEEAHSYLKVIKSTNLELLSTTYEKSFKVEFPTSLKHLNLHFKQSEAIKLDLRTLVNLEQFQCKNLFGLKSLKDLNISNSIKALKINSCGFEKLEDLRSLSKLKTLMIFGCKKLIDFTKCPFPDSLSFINYHHCVSASKIAELYESANNGMDQQFDLFDFSFDRTSFYIGSNMNFPTNLKTLYISDLTRTLKLGFNLNLKNVGILKLKNFSQMNLSGLLASLPKVMSGLSICGSVISSSEGIAMFPELDTLQFEKNTFQNVFRTNIHELKDLSILKLKHNISVRSEEDIRTDPFQLLSVVGVTSNIIETSANVEPEFNKKSGIVNVKMQKIMDLTLTQATQIEGVDPDTIKFLFIISLFIKMKFTYSFVSLNLHHYIYVYSKRLIHKISLLISKFTSGDTNFFLYVLKS